MTDAFPLDPRMFWETVAAFAGYDYSFYLADGTGHAPDPSAKSGYPAALVELAAKSKAEGLAGVVNADAELGTNFRHHRYTNCCMFVEAALVGTAMRTHDTFGPQWSAARHKWAMNIPAEGETEFGPPRAYAAVGIADPVLDIGATEKLIPGEVYVVQGAGHTWLIVDSDDGLCLRLEASFGSDDRPEFREPPAGQSGPFYGAVAHQGLGRVGARPDRKTWTDALLARPKPERWRWSTLRAALLEDLRKPGAAAYVSMARVRMRAAGAGPWLPTETVDATGRALEGRAALADAWQRSIAAGAPFPLGVNRTWHNGIHLDAVAGARVVPFASGELVAARFPPPTPDKVDQGAVILRHRFDRKAMAFLTSDAPPHDDEAVFYSAIVHLVGDAAGAKVLVDSVCPQSGRPTARVPAQTKLDVVAFDRDGKPQSLATSLWPSERDRPLPDAKPIAGLAGGALAVRLDPEEQCAAAWSPGGPKPVTAPTTAKAGIVDPATHDVVELDKAWVTTPIALGVDAGAQGKWTLRERGKAGDRTWLEPAAPPKVSGKPLCSHAAAERTSMNTAGGDVLVLPGGAARFTVTVAGRLVSGAVASAKGRHVIALSAPGTLADAPTKWRACVHVSAAELAAGSVGAGKRVLCLHDVDAGRVIETAVPLGGPSTPLAGPVVGKAGFAYVAGGAVTLHCDSGCCHPRAEVETLARHTGTGAVGTFDDPKGVALTVGTTAVRLTSTRMFAGVDSKGHLDVLPCVGLDDDELAGVRDDVAAARRHAGVEVADRIQAGTSRLVALPLGPAGWKIDDGTARPSSASAKAEIQRDLHVNKRGQWWFDGHDPVTLSSLPADFAWPVLATLSQPGKATVRAALVEVVLAAPNARFDDTLGKHWDDLAAFRKRVQNDLVAGWVDFAKVQKDDPETDAAIRARRWRPLMKQQVGAVGHAAPEKPGIHLEVFAEKHFLGDGVANGRWRELGADLDAKPRTAEFERAVASLLADGTLGERPSAKALRDQLARGARRPETWAAFCNDPDSAALFAEIVAVHESEWTTAWDEVLTPRDKGGPGVAHAPLAQAWPSDPKAMGLPEGKLRFYHPLRLFEWLTTGIEVRVRLFDTKPAEPAASITIDGREIDLGVTAGREELTFVQRALLARALPTGNDSGRTATLTIHHTKATIPDVPVVLRRGEITRVSLCEPGARVTRAPSGIRAGDNEFLLADGAQRFAGVSSNVVVAGITIFYNAQPPAQIDVSLDNPNFRIVAVSGEQYTASGDEAHRVLVPVAGLATPAAPTAHEVRLQVSIAAGTVVGAKAKLTVKVGGPDGGASVSTDIAIATRELGAAANEHGRDVEKLQIYLSRILGEGAPCHRKDRRSADDPWRPADPDGEAKATTHLALWRFILAFGRKGAWAPSTVKIRAEKGEHEIPAGGWQPKIDLATARHELDPRRVVLDADAKALLDRLGRPHVTAELIAELVRAAALPNVLPKLSLVVAPPTMPAALVANAAGLDTAGRSRLLPVVTLGSDHAARIEITAEALAGNPNTLSLDVVIEGTAYAREGAASRTLADLLSHGVSLRPTGAIADPKTPERVLLKHGDTVLGAVTLAGTRDLLEAKSGAGADVLLVQKWLMRWHDDHDKPYVAAITGKWDAAGKKALERFRAAHPETTATYAATLAALAKDPPPPSPAPATAP